MLRSEQGSLTFALVIVLTVIVSSGLSLWFYAAVSPTSEPEIIPSASATTTAMQLEIEREAFEIVLVEKQTKIDELVQTLGNVQAAGIAVQLAYDKLEDSFFLSQIQLGILQAKLDDRVCLDSQLFSFPQGGMILDFATICYLGIEIYPRENPLEGETFESFIEDDVPNSLDGGF